MAFLPKKTYSRHNDVTALSDKEKENVDPFDELLSSPLKQDVKFQPLSFWGKKMRRLESKEKSKKFDCGLFKGSDSDEPISPCQRKRKPKAGKARTLQPKSKTQKLTDKRRNYSTVNSCNNRIVASPLVPDEKETVVSTEKIWKNEGKSLDMTLNPNESLEEAFSAKSCDSCKFTDVNRHFPTGISVTPSHSVISNLKYKKKLNESPHHFNKQNNLNFKIYEDIGTSKEQLGKCNSEPLICTGNENSVNGSIHVDKITDETINYSHDSLKFVTVRRHFNYPAYIDGNYRSLLESAKLENNFLQSCDEPEKCVSLSNWKFKNVSVPQKYDSESSLYSDNSLINATLCENDLDKTLCNENSVSDLSENLKGVTRVKCLNQSDITDVTTPPDCDDETLVYNADCSRITTSSDDESFKKSIFHGNSSTNLSEESEEMSTLENIFSDFNDTDLISFNDTELGDMIHKLLNANGMDGVLLETSSTSDDTLSSFMDEETVINVRLKPENCDSPLTGTTKDVSHLISEGVSVLTSSMSELNIKNTGGSGSPEPENEKSDVPKGSSTEDKKRKSFSLGLRNVTTERRGISQKRYERNVHDRLTRAIRQESQQQDAEMVFNQSLLTMGRASIDWNNSFSFVNPVLESTRVFDAGLGDRKRQTNCFENNSILEDTLAGFDRTYALKPGKKWLRSRSVLKQLQNGTFVGDRLESTRITGRKFESFVQEMLEIQNERSGFFNSLADITVSNKTVIGGNVQNTRLSVLNASKTVLGYESLPEKSNESVFCNEKLLEKSSLNHTVKVIQEEEKPSAFRSALGLENNNSLPREDSILEESSSVSARDFILMQCGQEDILPFEEHFNERTLENCRKIGEGVYGEVFMCSDTVIKIIPIEGADKVNGEPQKTFAEIISEVVIASKLSNLRKGKKHRTDGFSEMKRCWCVKGKYPKYLLKLWNEYDEQGSGSENDSPVMFKDDQLYIILELANGGKDLESFVFSSSAQSLSVFIQASFSLAVAEKSFEFEHRDLHWGNVLISETKDKFMTVYLDGIEYKIPTKGVKVCIIDFTLSRINHDGCCIFNDLSVDPSLFASEGDYQFEIYRLMLKEVKNDWSLFRPKTNLFWLHYTLDKMLKMVRYKNKKAKVHIKHLKNLKSLECIVLEHNDTTDFVLGEPLNDVINKL